MSSSPLITPNGRWIVESGVVAPSQSEHFEELMEAARAVRENAYAPYSNFRVGSAVLMDDLIATGCNVENSSYGGTICAERSAIFSAVSTGLRKLQLIAISTDAFEKPEIENRSPCGFCRQVMSEFATPDTLVLLDSGSSEQTAYQGNIIPFESMLPWRFRLET